MPARKRRKKRPGEKREYIPVAKWFLFLSLFAVAACCVWTLYTGVRVENLVGDVRFVTAAVHDVTRTYEVTGLVIRDEKVYVSPISGIFRRLVPEGTRVARGTPVAEVRSGPPDSRPREESGADSDEAARTYRSFEAITPGVVSYRLDGLETALLPGLISQIDWDLYRGKGPADRSPLQNGAHVAAGTPLFKIVDNYQVYVALFAEGDAARDIARARKVSLEFPKLGENAQGLVVNDLSSRGGPLIVSLESSVSELFRVRELAVRATVRTGRGVMIPRTALVRRDGRELVYLSARQGARAKDVEVLAEEGDKVIVRGINDGAIVISNPWILW